MTEEDQAEDVVPEEEAAPTGVAGQTEPTAEAKKEEEGSHVKKEEEDFQAREEEGTRAKEEESGTQAKEEEEGTQSNKEEEAPTEGPPTAVIAANNGSTNSLSPPARGHVSIDGGSILDIPARTIVVRIMQQTHFTQNYYKLKVSNFFLAAKFEYCTAQ